jgi:myo-inositol catabolism protein IolC
MDLGYDSPLYILAFDHRGSFKAKMFGIAGDPTREEAASIADAKRLIFEGFRAALAGGAPAHAAGLLVDEESGAEVAREARAHGLIFAMPVEQSGREDFEFEYGPDFGAHIEDFDPTFVKVLVRFNPDGDAAMNARQVGRLKGLSAWLHEHDRKFLFELLVPAEPVQLASVGGDAGRYDREVRPGLMVAAVAALQAQGVEPDIWKIEGLDRREDCVRVAAQTRSGGRDGVACVVLGRGADDAAVEHWLRQGAGVPGYVGFAIGRTIWWDAVNAFLAAELPREAAAERIAARYREMIDVYESVASASGSP